MQKALIIGLSLVVMLSYSANAAFAYTQQESKKIINGAIAKYKAKNYVGCISDLKIYTSNDPNNAVAWYYLGTAYMRIGMRPEAELAFNRAIELDTVPQVTSYSVQAKLCMEDNVNCKYKVFSMDEIAQLKIDPKKFIAEALVPKEVEVPKIKNPYYDEINKLINHEYQGNTHPEAVQVLKRQAMIDEQAKVNSAKFNSPQQ